MIIRGILLLISFGTLAFAEPVSLTIDGHAISPAILTASDLTAYPRTQVEAVGPHSKVLHTYSGVTLRELLIAQGVPLGAKLRGRDSLQLVVRITARDGYAAIFALAEFDEAFSDRTILLADQIDGKPLPPASAPWQVIAPGDSRGARWVRMVSQIEIISLSPSK